MELHREIFYSVKLLFFILWTLCYISLCSLCLVFYLAANEGTLEATDYSLCSDG